MKYTKRKNMNSKTLKILLVEDDIPAQRATRLLLISKFDCEVLVAGSGEEALQMAADNMYDLILMDIIGLPGINGIETTGKLKQLKGINRQTPVVAVTAHTDEHIRQQCKEVGMEAFLAKPFRYTELQIILKQLKLI